VVIWRCKIGWIWWMRLDIPAKLHQFLPSMQQGVRSGVVLMKDDTLSICQFRTLSSIALVGLIGNSICPNLSSGCVEGVRNIRSSNPTDTQHYLLRMQTGFGAVNDGSYHFPQDLFRSTCKQSIFHRPWLFVSKMDHSLRLSK